MRAGQQRKLILLSLDWTRPKDPPISLGQASILATLRQHQVPTFANAWSVNQPDFHFRKVFHYAMQHASPNTDLALGAFVWHEPSTQKLLDALKAAKFPGRIILGGPQISYTKKGIERYYPQADVFIRGYAEHALAQLMLSKTLKPAIIGVHYAGEPDQGKSAAIDLESIPSPILGGLIPPQPFIRWETQRGCPFRCAFCQHRESDVTMVRQQFSKTRLYQETQWLLSHPVINDIAVLDPTFNSGPHYLWILEQFIAQGYQGKLSLQCRAEMVNDKFLDLVQALNKTAQVVLEFGLQTIHRHEAKLIERPNNCRKVTEVLKQTHQRNIATEVSLIFGLPGQTLASFKESIQFCIDLQVPTIFAFPLMLLRGTPLHDKKHQLGLLESSDLDSLDLSNRISNHIPHVVQSPSFTISDWHNMAALAKKLDDYNQQHQNKGKMAATLKQTLWQQEKQTKQLVQANSSLARKP